MDRVVGLSPAKDRLLGIAARSILGVAVQAITAVQDARQLLGVVARRFSLPPTSNRTIAYLS